jgi:hypothetical protein
MITISILWNQKKEKIFEIWQSTYRYALSHHFGEPKLLSDATPAALASTPMFNINASILVTVWNQKENTISPYTMQPRF